MQPSVVFSVAFSLIYDHGFMDNDLQHVGKIYIRWAVKRLKIWPLKSWNREISCWKRCDVATVRRAYERDITHNSKKYFDRPVF